MSAVRKRSLDEVFDPKRVAALEAAAGRVGLFAAALTSLAANDAPAPRLEPCTARSDAGTCLTCGARLGEPCQLPALRQ